MTLGQLILSIIILLLILDGIRLIYRLITLEGWENYIDYLCDYKGVLLGLIVIKTWLLIAC